MGICIEHTSCPKCGSKDNRAIYSDGSSWCFGCGKYTSPTHREILIEKPPKHPPKDLTSNLPYQYCHWLDKYELTKEEKVHFKWSPSLQRLCTVLSADYWEGRSLNQEPKVLSQGKKPTLFIKKNILYTYAQEDTVVLVEDFISALKVGRHYQTHPLLGSIVAIDKLIPHWKSIKNIYIWLDHDKYPNSLEVNRTLHILGYNTKAITTRLDPKLQTDETIKTLIG